MPLYSNRKIYSMFMYIQYIYTSYCAIHIYIAIVPHNQKLLKNKDILYIYIYKKDIVYPFSKYSTYRGFLKWGRPRIIHAIRAS